LKDSYSIDKDKGKEVGYDIGLLLEYKKISTNIKLNFYLFQDSALLAEIFVL
jgi:hypothetical protein